MSESTERKVAGNRHRIRDGSWRTFGANSTAFDRDPSGAQRRVASDAECAALDDESAGVRAGSAERQLASPSFRHTTVADGAHDIAGKNRTAVVTAYDQSATCQVHLRPSHSREGPNGLSGPIEIEHC